jgi:plastocyanin
MKKRMLLFVAALGLALLLASCTHLQSPVAAGEKQNVVEMTASDFKFQPNNITTRTGDAITFKIRNTSGSTHNFTLTDPDGNPLRNVDISPGQSVDVTITFSKPGTYTFHCNRIGHSELGMKGQVVATGS